MEANVAWKTLEAARKGRGPAELRDFLRLEYGGNAYGVLVANARTDRGTSVRPKAVADRFGPFARLFRVIVAAVRRAAAGGA